MAKNYVRKSTRCSTYDGESLKKALDALTNGQLLSKVIREYGVPARTLRRHQKAMTTSPETIKLSRLILIVFLHSPFAPCMGQKAHFIEVYDVVTHQSLNYGFLP
ncbi:hypothetical protein HELRODRAFT_161316 [Helobdella robusta]|uniref:HTH psq-type domain-containing protein n=1 Tax=Helobdella robusta TaxID=6412 RepID=T1ERB8_HELRO|nr:hypothetical protein HELRODRAFT_161316 [Helobdella robusta]ESO02085.1 hypothetical protein HELRODRAFT_161316 [Helobdella robusta]